MSDRRSSEVSLFLLSMVTDGYLYLTIFSVFHSDICFDLKILIYMVFECLLE